MVTNKDYRYSIILGISIGIGLAFSFGVGYFISQFSTSTISWASSSVNNTTHYPLLGEVQRLLDQVYLRDLPKSPRLEYGAIRGMLETLDDPTTFFIEPPVAQSESQALAGTYGGIGVQVQRLESGEFAIYPFDDSPASGAGFRDNDILMSINDIDIDINQQIDIIDQMLRGEVKDNNGVRIQVKRINGDIIERFVPFQVINIPSVTSRIVNEDDRIGYIQILRFTSRTPEELKSEVVKLFQNNILALIIDLRDNSGGLLVESIQVADEFLDEGIIVIERSRNSRELFTASDDGELTEITLAVLVNNRTASASELVAGALQDNERGILIGQQTFGKGTVQQIFALSDSSSVHITSAEWLTPNEQTISANGLTPDIVMIPDENGRDVEFGEAIRYLQSILEK